VHHTPVGPPLSARIRSALRRWIPVCRPASPFRMRRVAPLLLVGMATALITVVAFAVPALSGSRPPVSLDSSTSNSTGGASPVVMGVDGRPVAGTSTSRQHRSTQPSSAAPGGQAGTVTREPDRAGTTTAAGDATGTQTLAGSTGPAGTSSKSRSKSSSPAPSSSPSSSSSSSAPSSSSSAPPPAPSPGNSDNVLALVNAARAEAGCADLTSDDALAAAAVANSTAMAAQGVLAVLDAAGTGSAIAAGEPDADSVVSAWLADPTDQATLLNCTLTTAGVGQAGGDGGPWWTLFLA